MNKKCPKCGYEYGEFDLYCARCGYKLSTDEEVNNNSEETLKRIVFGNFGEIVKQKSQNDTQKPKNKTITDSFAFNFTISMIIVSIMLIGVVFIIAKNQNMHRYELHYKSLISNPARIPELKEPKTFDELYSNLRDVEKFLYMYMNHPDNPQEKKEQIFASFLKEMDKMPHITNETVVVDDGHICANITNHIKAQRCADKLNKEFHRVGIKAYSSYNTVYLYPDNKFIKKTYYKFLSSPLRAYLNLRAKYNNPVTVGLNMYIEPKVLANKIYDYEKLYNTTTDSYIKDEAEYLIYDDFRKFIFTPSIYDTTTHEMTKEFKKAYEYFIKTKKNSALYPVVLSYMDKKRSYDEDNFRNDYPYRIFEATFEENVRNNALSDIFAQLRKNIFSNSSEYLFAYTYSTLNGTWHKYDPNSAVEQNDYVVSEPDENNNIVIYNNTFAPSQEINISKYGRLFMFNGGLYVFNSDKLQISKILYNGRVFQNRNLTNSDVASVFPGIEIINIDSYSNYNIYIEKENQKSNYIILSKYSQGYSDYVLSSTKGSIDSLILPNMFAVDSVNDTVVAFHGKDINPEGTSENAPTYKFIIHTHGQKISPNSEDSGYAQYDQKTADEQDDEDDKGYRPNIMPKLPDKSEANLKDDILKAPPSQILEPPNDND